MNVREKAAKIVHAHVEAHREHGVVSVYAEALIDEIEDALTVPPSHVRDEHGVDHSACTNCGAWWDRKGQCPLCMNTANETAALAARRAVDAERVVAGAEDDKDGALCMLLAAATHNGDGPIQLHKSHVLNTLARIKRFKNERDASESRVRELEEAVGVLGYELSQYRDNKPEEHLRRARAATNVNPIARAALEGKA